jgi:hypothetical protein
MIPRFKVDDVERANTEWGCNCGPSALAAIAGITLDEVRPHMGDFESKRYTNPTLMFAALRSVGRAWREVGPGDHTIGRPWPRYGLCRIQWEGPWTQPGVPMAARYRQTHWVGAATKERYNVVGVWDVNAIDNGTGWASLADWATVLVPHILTSYPRANGRWHITHAIEVDPIAATPPLAVHSRSPA